jgi:hypothetical protein
LYWFNFSSTNELNSFSLKPSCTSFSGHKPKFSTILAGSDGCSGGSILVAEITDLGFQFL